MKFVKLRMKDFMRYKGENILNFSRDSEKNVTVVLGDNTIGKTTLAQAFRWVLYGELINTQYEDSKKMCILNNEVLGDMTANDRHTVEVELKLEKEALKGERDEYRIIRKAMFIRKFPQLVAVQQSESLKMYVKNTENGKEISYDNAGNGGKDKGKVDEKISELLPKNLSSYFLFDGERWNSEKNTKSDIKDSIYNLVGISPIREMKKHLGEYGTQGKSSVIKSLRSKLTGSGDEYGRIISDIDRYYKKIEAEEQNIKDALENAESFQKKADEIFEILNASPHVEEDQRECKRLADEIKFSESRMKTYYSDVISSFSNAHVYFAAPLLQEIVDKLEHVELEGVDIPGIIDKTIYYLLEQNKCLCGNPICECEINELKKLLKVVPPAIIGTEVSNFRNKITKWEHEGAELYDAIIEKAKLCQSEKFDILDKEEELAKKEKKIDKKINFSQERIRMNTYNNTARAEREKARKSELNIDDYKHKITSLEKEKDTLDEKTELNLRLKRYIAYAEELYKIASQIYKSKEDTLLKDLNSIIEKNFREMFNEQEKLARLGDDYVLRLFYKRVSNSNGYSDLEATGLSEGEKIARNFAFIVSILELANKEKENGDDIAQSLPLVLDGPFSKLSSVNTAKVAKVLPNVSEQVIIFMLDKDWEASGLSNYVNKQYMYRTVKDIDGNSSSISQEV